MFKNRLLQGDENVIASYRKHEIVLLPTVLKIFVLLFVPWHILIRSRMLFSDSTATKLLLLWTIVILGYGIRKFLLWFYNAYYITNHRLICVEHSGLFKKRVSEVPLSEIGNVNFGTKGFLSTIFRYGDVVVQAKASETPLTLSGVPNPARVKDFVWQMHSQHLNTSQPDAKV
jgi:uncharacterized membrane protein YdbT with pleckstrin-like domain